MDSAYEDEECDNLLLWADNTEDDDIQEAIEEYIAMWLIWVKGE